MANPFIPLSKAAIKADMTKNEGLIFLALVIQTIGYRKSKDNLTDKRLAQLTGIRLDHLRPCLESFLDYGLFERIEHKHYDYQYRLCDEFLDESEATIIYPPSLPTSPSIGEIEENAPNLPEDGGKPAPRSGSFTDDGGHTTDTPYIKNQQQTKTTFNQKQQTEPKKKFMQQQPQPPVTISLTGLESLPKKLIIESSQPVRIEFSAQAKESDNAAEVIEQTAMPKANAVAEIETVKAIMPHTENAESTEIMPQPVAEPEPMATSCEVAENTVSDKNEQEIEQEVKPEIKSDMDVATKIDTMPQATPTATTTAKPVADLAVSVATALIQSRDDSSAETTEEPPVVVNEKKGKKPLKIPKAVGEENYNACNRYFDLLNAEQKQSVLTVFFYNLKLGGIRNKARYFIGIAKKAQEDKLTVPVEATAKATSGPLTFEQQEAKKEANKKHEDYLSCWADYQWITRQAKALDKSEEEVAEMLGMEKAYQMFSQQACAAAA
jgi:hypothetical protein